MAEVAMAVSIKRYYIEKTANINVKKSLYTSVMDSRIKNSKNWNCEFSCGARRRCDDVLYTYIHSSYFLLFLMGESIALVYKLCFYISF